MGVHALPVNAGTLQDDQLDLQFPQPRGQGLEVAFEAAEFALLLDRLAAIILNQDSDDLFHAMYVDTGDTFVECFHELSPVVTMKLVRSGHRSVGTGMCEIKTSRPSSWGDSCLRSGVWPPMVSLRVLCRACDANRVLFCKS